MERETTFRKAWLTKREIADLDVSLAEVTAKANKLGVPAPTYHLTGREKPRPTPFNGVTTPTYEVAYDITPVRYNGWKFLAVVDHKTNIVLAAPDAPEGIVAEYIGTEPTCDVCGHARHRVHTIVVENDEGKRLRVGGTCVKDYIGNLRLNPYINHLRGYDEFGLHFRVKDTVFPTVWVVAISAAIIADIGYVKSGDDTKNPTKGEVRLALRPPVTLRPEVREWIHKINTEARENIEKAHEIIEWAKALEGDSDFTLNLRAVAETDEYDCTDRGFGILVYLAEGYRRAKAKEVETKKLAELENTRLPAPKGRTLVTGLVTTVRVEENEYSYYAAPTVKFRVLDDRGFAVWSTCPSSLSGVEVGDRVEFSVDLSPSDDPYFSFGKRPTKARFLDAV